MKIFITSILIFPGKVKPSGRIFRPKRRKRSIFVFIEKCSFNNSDYLQKARKYGHFTGYKN